MRTTVFCFCGIALIAMRALHADEQPPQAWWPQFRGPGARGIAEGGTYPTHFSPTDNVLWKAAVPAGVSSPCIWGDRIFITAYAQGRKTLETICLNRADGSILWRKDAPAEQIENVNQVSSPANATPATDGAQVYVYFASYGLICYDFDGVEQWKTPLPFRNTRFGSGTSPIVVGRLVVLNQDALGEGQAHILAVRANDGTPAWKTKRTAGFVHYSTPVVWNGAKGREVLLMGSNRLTSYDLSTGTELWWIDQLPPQICATPQVDDGNVYVTGTGMYGEPQAFLGLPDFDKFLTEHDKDGDGRIGLEEIPDGVLVVDRRASRGAGNSPLKQFARGIDQNRDQKIDRQEWERFEVGFGNFVKQVPPGVSAIRLGGEGDVTKSNMRWQATTGAAEVPSLLVLADRIFLVRNGGIVHCRDLKTGKDLYRERLGAVGGYYASPVAGGGQIYFASDRGTVTVVAANAAQLQILARNDLEEPIIATPALVDGRIYLRTQAHLYAFGE